MKKALLVVAMILVASSFSFSQKATKMDNPPAPVMVQSQMNSNHGSGCTYLVFMNNLPWGTTSIQDILTANGETFSIANSAQMATIDFSQYDVIITASDQVEQFYLDFTANFSKFVTFVTNGGTLEVHAATAGWNSPCETVQLPGGVQAVCGYSSCDNVVMAAHPIVAGVSSPFCGNYASHGYFTNMVSGTDIITVQGNTLLPSTIQYHYGTGVVTGTTVTYEASYAWGWEGGKLLVNNLNYACEHAIDAQTPISDWAIGIGIFLIIGAALLRYKRLV